MGHRRMLFLSRNLVALLTALLLVAALVSPAAVFTYEGRSRASPLP